MSGVSTGDALAKALNRGVRRGIARSSRHPTLIPAEVIVQEVERALIASGAVVDVATLADDEALVERTTALAFRYPTPTQAYITGGIFRALSRALTERAR